MKKERSTYQVYKERRGLRMLLPSIRAQRTQTRLGTSARSPGIAVEDGISYMSVAALTANHGNPRPRGFQTACSPAEEASTCPSSLDQTSTTTGGCMGPNQLYVPMSPYVLQQCAGPAGWCRSASGVQRWSPALRRLPLDKETTWDISSALSRPFRARWLYILVCKMREVAGLESFTDQPRNKCDHMLKGRVVHTGTCQKTKR